MDEFFRTRMGHEFFMGTMPALVNQLKRLNDNLEKIAATLADRSREPKTEPFRDDGTDDFDKSP